jgi:hypothetical protein
MAMNDEICAYGRGWAFLVGGGIECGLPVPTTSADLREWIKGYAAALADDDPAGYCPSIEAALRADGIEGDTLEKLLLAAESIEQGDDCRREFCRWPACPVRTTPDAWRGRNERMGQVAEMELLAEVIARELADWPRGWREVEGGPERDGGAVIV